MAETPQNLPTGGAKRRWRPARWLIAMLVGLGLVIGATALLLDSGAGRRFLTDRIGEVAPESGLRIRVGRIEGSIYRRATLRDVRLYDPKGEFLRAGEVRLDWHPFDFLLRNRLTIDGLDIPRATLSRLPELNETDDDKPILPDFDIVIDRLRVDRLDVGAEIAGEARTATLTGSADIRSGTARVKLDARLIDGSDRVAVDLVAAPDRADFDIDADIVASRGGVLAAMAGIDRGLTAVVRGQGDWQRWQGSLLADSDGTPLARLRLSAHDGLYGASGRLRLDLFTTGLPQRLTAGGVAVEASGRFAQRRWDGTASLVGDGLQIDTAGSVDLAQNRFGALRIDGWLRRPAVLLDGMDGQNVRLSARLDGAMAGPRFDYRLSAPWLAFGRTRLTGIEARGSGIGGAQNARIPLRLSIASVTGIGALAEGIVRNLAADGTLQWRKGVLTSDRIRVRSNGLNGRIAVTANFSSGDYLVGFDGAVPGLEIAGLGRVDLVTDLNVRRRRDGALAIGGTARANMRRLDNDFLRTLTGGLPVVTTALTLGPDGIVRFSNMRVTSPLLTLSAEGLRRADGTVQLSGRGVHRTYGPVIVTLDGPIERPRVDVRLASPLAAAGLSHVQLQLVPTAAGFDFTAKGGSMLGQFTATGQIMLPRGGTAIIDIRRLAVGGTVASGRLAVVTGGLTGQLQVAGGGIDGTIGLAVPDATQQIILALTARDATFAGPPPLSVRRGQINATILLDSRGTDVDATFQATGVRRGTLSIARIAGTARLVDGVGAVRGSIAGARGRDFTFQFAADVGRDRYRISGAGTLARQPLRLVRPAVIRRTDDGWRLDPTELTYAGGRARLSGAYGDGTTEILAALDNLPLALVDLAYPDLNLGGRVSGRLTYRDGDSAPTGDAQLRLRNFTRTGLTDGGAPLDIALNAALTANSAALRAVIERNGGTIGRMQARTAPLGDGADIVSRIVNAPLTAQLRYNGEAGTLWQLARIDSLSLSGPVTIVADATGTVNAPLIRGTVRTNGARFESFQTGTVVTDIDAFGRFDGSRLQLRNITGQTTGGGRVTGEGDFDLSATGGFGMDLRLNATNALLIERDDLVARVTGPARLFSSGNGGTITGNMILDAGRFRLGQATAADALPVLTMIERNAPADRSDLPARGTRWDLNVRVRGDDGFIVTGLGLESEWSTDVRVRGPVDDFSIIGQARMVRGDYNFAGRRFALESGTIRFTGDTVDPVLDIVAVDDIAGIDATIRVRGTGTRPDITFSSVPALPEDELLSRILFGSSITDISVTEAAQLGLALASLRSGGDLDPINAIRRATGLDRLRILPANSELGSGTSVAAGKYITRRVFVEVITDGQGYSATRAEYQVTRWLAILAAISTLNDESINVRIKRDY
jgi:translocation and assembly module TamB